MSIRSALRKIAFKGKRNKHGNLQVVKYAGNPTNNVTAPEGTLCLDTTNSHVYINKTELSSGWVRIDA